MFIKVFAVFCHILAGQSVEVCDKVTIADSQYDDTLTMRDCYAQDKLAEFMRKSPLYHNARVQSMGCRIGNKPDPTEGQGKA